MKRMVGLVLVFCLAVAGGALWTTEEARALPCHEDFCDYYSDATYTTWVGSKNTTCLGVRYVGQQTQYYICYTGDICPWCGGCEPVCP
jgi:hypothetical protein